MTAEELAHRMMAMLTGDDTPGLHAYVDACIAACPPPSGPGLENLTPEDFDAVVAQAGGAETLRRVAARYYGIAVDPKRNYKLWPVGFPVPSHVRRCRNQRNHNN